MARPVKKTTKAEKITKPTPVTKKAPPKAQVPASTSETPAWVTGVAIALIILGYAIYRFWGVAKVGNITISRLDYYNAMERQVGKQTLDNLITETLIAKAGRDQNVIIDQKAIDDQIATISAQIIAQGQTIEQALAAENITIEEVRRQYGLQQIVDTLGKGDVTVSDKEVADYIKENQDTLPSSLSETELNQMVRSQPESQKASQNISTWVENLKNTAEVIRY